MRATTTAAIRRMTTRPTRPRRSFQRRFMGGPRLVRENTRGADCGTAGQAGCLTASGRMFCPGAAWQIQWGQGGRGAERWKGAAMAYLAGMAAPANIEWLFAGAGWTFGAAGALLVAWALFWDRA